MVDTDILLRRVGSVLAPALSAKCTLSMHTQLQASGLQLLDVNTSFLDSLVLDYLAAEDFVEVRGVSCSGVSVSQLLAVETALLIVRFHAGGQCRCTTTDQV
jgi:hypothetical protein